MLENDISAFDRRFAFTSATALPEITAIGPDDFADAFDRAMAGELAEVEAIANEPDEHSFDNTILALERSGRILSRVASLFFALAGAETSDALQAVEREVAPKLSRHGSAISLNPALFARIDALHERRAALALTPEQLRLLERVHGGFLRSGARLEGPDRGRFADLNAR
ncbi:MAG: peptidase M3, partial [Sphingomonadales bacterium]